MGRTHPQDLWMPPSILRHLVPCLAALALADGFATTLRAQS